MSVFRFHNLFLLVLVLIGASVTNAQQVLFYYNGRLCAARTAAEGKLLDAVNEGRESSVRLLLQRGTSARLTDDCGISVLIYAIAATRIEIMRLLIAAGADVNARFSFVNSVPLSRALSINDPEDRYAVVKLLIESGSKVDVGYGQKPLMEAVSKEDVRVVELLIASGANVNLQDDDARNGYSVAAELGNQELREILLAAGADPTVGVAKYRQIYGQHAFFQAAADGRVDVVEAMLNRRLATVNMSNASKVTALMRAHDEPMVDALVSAGADVNLQDDRGFTALMWAAEIRRTGVVKKLIAAGADVNLRRNDGKAAIDFVSDDEIEKLLTDAGASRQKPQM